jgi:hypothetical protein
MLTMTNGKDVCGVMEWGLYSSASIQPAFVPLVRVKSE